MSGERVAALISAIVGLAAAVLSRTFPAAAGQSVGPGVFPGIMGAALALVGVSLVWQLRPSRRLSHPQEPTVEPADGAPHTPGRAALVVLTLAGYAAVVTAVGFFISSAALLLVLFLGFGVGVVRSLAFALVIPVVVHYVFYAGLRVPLPWGVLERFAW